MRWAGNVRKWRHERGEFKWPNSLLYKKLVAKLNQELFSFQILFLHQVEDIEVTIADHIQRVLKPNFGAAWDEVGDEFEKEETFTLSTVKTLEGEEVA